MNRKIKVLHVIPSVGFARGGPSAVVRTLTEHQAMAGAEVHVACTDDNGPDHLENPDRSLANSLVRYWIFRRQARPYTFSWPLAAWVKRHIRDFDLIHVHALFSHASVTSALAAQRMGVPYIVEPHGLLNRWGMESRRPLAKALSFRLIERRILHRAAAVLYGSRQEFLEAQQLGVPHEALVVPNPVEIPPSSGREPFRAAQPDPSGSCRILFLSRLDPIKGLDLLLAAFAQVLNTHPEARLLIAGAGEERYVEGLKRSAQELGCTQRIEWLGFLTGDRKSATLAEADIFVLPSYSESFGVVVVEAMGAGVPVIVSERVALHQEISAAHAGIVVKCSVADLADALRRSLDSSHLRSALGSNGRRLAQDYAPDTVAENLLTAYRRILVSSKTPVAA